MQKEEAIILEKYPHINVVAEGNNSTCGHCVSTTLMWIWYWAISRPMESWAKEVDIAGEWLRYEVASGSVTRVYCEACFKA